jgi:hypothetical protein
MIKNICEHKWEKHTNAGRNLESGSISATYICNACQTKLTASEVFQLESLEHLKGFQTYIAIVAIFISFIALLVSIFK